MKQLSRTQTVIFLAGGLLMVAGAGCSLLMGFMPVAPYLFCLGALGFSSMQMMQRYEGSSFTIRRLRRIMIVSDVLFLLAGLLMLADVGNPLKLGHLTYMQYVYRKWVVVLLIAAVLQLYTTHRIGSELEKEAKKR